MDANLSNSEIANSEPCTRSIGVQGFLGCLGTYTSSNRPLSQIPSPDGGTSNEVWIIQASEPRAFCRGW